MANEEALKANPQITPLLRVVAYHAASVSPELNGLGLSESIKGLLQRSKMKMEQIDAFEVVETFAALYLAVERELHMRKLRSNKDGGSIAMGHPISATGAIVAIHLAHNLKYTMHILASH